MAIAFGFLRHNVYYMCGFNWLPECFEAPSQCMLTM
jgi:hypothetical protein